ncbi:MAG: hypothetical protein R6U61_03740 [Thermoplasmata archaeon]
MKRRDDRGWNEMDVRYERGGKPMKKAIRWRTVLSIITAFGWLAFLVIWLFFYAGDYTVYQNLGVILLSLIILFFINGSAWKSINKGDGWKSVFTMLTGLILCVFFAYWLYYHASDYSLLENIGVFILSILFVGAANSLIWIPLDSRTGWRSAVSAVSSVGWIIFLIYWLMAYSSTFNIYQNIAIFIVSILVLAGINVVVWLSFIFD